MTTNARATRRNLRKRRVRAAISGTAARPRLSVFRSNTQFSAQLVDDESATTIAAVSSKAQKGASAREKIEAAGAEIAQRAQEKGITKVVFDRSGFLYTGNVKAFADAARAGGLEF